MEVGERGLVKASREPTSGRKQALHSRWHEAMCGLEMQEGQTNTLWQSREAEQPSCVAQLVRKRRQTRRSASEVAENAATPRRPTPEDREAARTWTQTIGQGSESKIRLTRLVKLARGTIASQVRFRTSVPRFQVLWRTTACPQRSMSRTHGASRES